MRDLGHEPQSGGGTQVAGACFGPLALQGVRMRFQRNEEVFGAGEEVEHVYRVVSGAVRTMRYSSDGRRQILAFHLPGDVFGLELGDTHEYSAEAVVESELVLTRRSVIERAAAESTTAARALLQLAANQLHEAQEHALMLGRKGAGERVAAFLLRLTERLTSRQQVDLPMSRLDIADHLALTIETVSRAFTQMEREHTISLPSSRRVVVRNRNALEQLQAA
jgi:CRP/FNR family nitrogen fixation transcriptional regulator